VKTPYVFCTGTGYVASDIWLSIAATGMIKFVKMRRIVRGTNIVLYNGQILGLRKGVKASLDGVRGADVTRSCCVGAAAPLKGIFL
jgi:hypothetical protein